MKEGTKVADPQCWSYFEEILHVQRAEKPLKMVHAGVAAAWHWSDFAVYSMAKGKGEASARL